MPPALLKQGKPAMLIELTREQQEIIRGALEAGRVKRAEEVVKQALELWVERERRRDEILAAIDEGEASLAGDEGIAISKASVEELGDDIKRRGRARLAGEANTRR
jgi:Arc/MetJ-type ribon-helix-helix transcriptional regulator